MVIVIMDGWRLNARTMTDSVTKTVSNDEHERIDKCDRPNQTDVNRMLVCRFSRP